MFMHTHVADTKEADDGDTVIVVSHYNENLNWLKKSRHRVVVCDKAGSKKSPFVPDKSCSLSVNRGREASTFLKYIIENYDTLPPFVAFIHGHERAWHQKLPFSLLEAIERARKHDYDFINLNALEHSKVFSPAALAARRERAGHVEVSHVAHHLLKSVWEDVFQPILRVPFPEHLRFMCCAQFVVSARAIRRHPKSDYVKLLEFVTAGPERNSDWARGAALEFVWHMLLGGESADRCEGAPPGECNVDRYVRTRFLVPS